MERFADWHDETVCEGITAPSLLDQPGLATADVWERPTVKAQAERAPVWPLPGSSDDLAAMVTLATEAAEGRIVLATRDIKAGEEVLGSAAYVHLSPNDSCSFCSNKLSDNGGDFRCEDCGSAYCSERCKARHAGHTKHKLDGECCILALLRPMMDRTASSNQLQRAVPARSLECLAKGDLEDRQDFTLACLALAKGYQKGELPQSIHPNGGVPQRAEDIARDEEHYAKQLRFDPTFTDVALMTTNRNGVSMRSIDTFMEHYHAYCSFVDVAAQAFGKRLMPNVSEDVYVNLRCVLVCNGYELRQRGDTTSRGTALVPTGGMMNHSCAPSVMRLPCSYALPTGRLVLSYYACRDVAAGEELLLSYVDPRQKKVKRRQTLLNSQSFTCMCPRCTGDDDGNVFDPAKDMCPSCRSPGYLMPAWSEAVNGEGSPAADGSDSSKNRVCSDCLQAI